MRRQQARLATAAMKNTSSTRTIRLDIGDPKQAVCVLGAKGEVLKQETITNTRPSLLTPGKRPPGGC
jgi:hypothetical protein